MVLHIARRLSTGTSPASCGHPHQIRYVMLVLVFGFLRIPAVAKYAGGNGTEEDPYLIYTADEMNAIGANPNDWDKDFKLMADIDMAQCSDPLNLIGYHGPDVGSSPDKSGFSGVFDGNGHRISNVAYTSAGLDAVGLFRHLDDHQRRRRAIIKNLGLIEPSINAGTGDYTGALVGFFRNGLVTGCYVHGGRVSGNAHVGGLVGGTVNTAVISYFPRLEIHECHATTAVSGTEWVGGLIGSYEGSLHLLEPSVISKCYAMGDVVGVTGVGGLVGIVASGEVINCYAQARVSASLMAGGLLGRSCAIVNSCYAAGRVNGTEEVGGLIGSTTTGLGWPNEAQANSSCWDVEASGQTISAGGAGKTTWQMRQRSTFGDWDFTDVWDIAEDQTYPFLRRFLMSDDNTDCNVD